MAKKKEKVYKQYSSAKKAIRFVTPNGRVIKVVNHSFTTCNKEEIEYLEELIEEGSAPFLSEGKQVTQAEADPMIGLRQRIAAEERAKVLAELEAGKAGNKEGVNEDTADIAKRLGALTSANIPAAESNSK